MGCGASAEAEARVARLVHELNDTKARASEQQNLLRFKIEVLVNMLAVEEKKSEGVTKRVETLKWLLHEQGVAEQTLNSILLRAEKDVSEDTRNEMLGSAERSISFRNVGMVDLAGALSRAEEEFEHFKADIVPAFADEDGRVISTLTNNEFMKQLYTVTEVLTKADIQIIALRFGDGSGCVSVPEFLEFFTTPSQMRMAKAATAAVRMSLDLLQLGEGDDEMEPLPDDEDGLLAGETGVLLPLVVSSHLSINLDRGVRRLLHMWPVVKKDLELAFIAAEDTDADPQVVSVDAFNRILTERCGALSSTLAKARNDGKITLNASGRPMVQLNQPTVVEPLTSDDVEMLAVRFDLSSMVHYGHFMQYFKELYTALRLSSRRHIALPISSSPFTVNSEWQVLRHSSVLNTYSAGAGAGTGADNLPQPPASSAQSTKPPVQSTKAPVQSTKAPALSIDEPAPPKREPPPKEPKPKPADKAESPDAVAKSPEAVGTPDSKPDDKHEGSLKLSVEEPLEQAPGPDVVEIGAGMGCCGAGLKATPHSPPEAAPKMPEDKVASIVVSAKADRGDKDVSDDEGEVVPKSNTGFNTPPVPRDRIPSSKPSFRPRTHRDIESEDSEGDIHRAGLGRQDADETDLRVRNSNSRFRRRDEEPAQRSSKSTADEEEVQTRWKGRA